jgi:hypothetical protein
MEQSSDPLTGAETETVPNAPNNESFLGGARAAPLVLDPVLMDLLHLVLGLKELTDQGLPPKKVAREL